MLLGRYTFSAVFLDPAVLPSFKGSTFRGAFGGAFKKVVCAVREKECGRCLLANRCLYAQTFETTTPASQGLRQAAPPHPYVIEPPRTSQTHFAAGDSFDFDLLLFGSSNDSLPYFVYAFDAMGETGLGKRLAGQRGRFRLTAVHHNGRGIFDPEQHRLEPVKLSDFTLTTPGPAAVEEVTIVLHTALRLKFANHLQAELPFHLLVRAMLRRVSSLFATFGDGEPPLDYRGLVARAAAVEVARSNLRWVDWERYSSRQDQTMLMGGMLGTVTYRGPLGEYLPLIEAVRELHLGKQTAFGLGRIEHSWSAES